MSMRVEFVADPKGMFPERVNVGDIKWVPRALAMRLIKEGFAVLRGPDFNKGYEVAALQQTEKAVKEAGPPLKSQPNIESEPPEEWPPPPPVPDEEEKIVKKTKSPKKKTSGGKRDEKGRFKGRGYQDDTLPPVRDSGEVSGEDSASVYEELLGGSES